MPVWQEGGASVGNIDHLGWDNNLVVVVEHSLVVVDHSRGSPLGSLRRRGHGDTVTLPVGRRNNPTWPN